MSNTTGTPNVNANPPVTVNSDNGSSSCTNLCYVGIFLAIMVSLPFIFFCCCWLFVIRRRLYFLAKNLRRPSRNETVPNNNSNNATTIPTRSSHQDFMDRESNSNHNVLDELRFRLPLFVRRVFPSPNHEVETQHSSPRNVQNCEMVCIPFVFFFFLFLIMF